MQTTDTTATTTPSDAWGQLGRNCDGALNHVKGYVIQEATVSQALRRLAGVLEKVEDDVSVIALKVDYQSDVVEQVRVTALCESHKEVQAVLRGHQMSVDYS